VPGGFAEVGPSGLTILANQAIDFADLDAAKLDAGIAGFEEEISRAKTDEARRVAVEKRDQLLEVKVALKI
jgi:F-type H+-transporting ATPase subunit epsilon